MTRLEEFAKKLDKNWKERDEILASMVKEVQNVKSWGYYTSLLKGDKSILQS